MTHRAAFKVIVREKLACVRLPGDMTAKNASLSTSTSAVRRGHDQLESPIGERLIFMAASAGGNFIVC
jgi:hypothetical protein